MTYHNNIMKVGHMTYDMRALGTPSDKADHMISAHDVNQKCISA